MQPARIPAGGAFPIVGQPTVEPATFSRGAVLVLQAGNTGLCLEAGVNPTQIVGVALQGGDTNPGYAAANNPTTITGRSAEVSVATANKQTVFQATLTNGSNVAVQPVNADIGAQYGITGYNAGTVAAVWVVDKAKTGASARVAVVDFDTVRQIVFFRFIDSSIIGSN